MAKKLSKSRFKLAIECPAKLNYTGNKEYANTSLEDDFLRALADGGFQVGELAKLRDPDGIEIDARDQSAQIAQTTELLSQDNVTLFEATLCSGHLLARVDVLRKKGKRIDLIEVKAKSWNSSKRGESFWTIKPPKRIMSEWLPYLQDVAFQTYLCRLIYPDHDIHSWLLMPDKARVATSDGINQCFILKRENGRSTCEVVPGTTRETIGADLLVEVPVDDCVGWILAQQIESPGAIGTFPDIVQRWATDYAQGTRIPPTVGAHCAKCEFKESAYPNGLKSGFHECWKLANKWQDKDFETPNVLSLFKANSAKKQQLIEEGKLHLTQLTEEDIGPETDSDTLTPRRRQWMQCSSEWPGEDSFFIDKPKLKGEMAKWEYPYHFIDFEACQPALPFKKGRKPYERIAFQFSHHTMQPDGTVAHANEFIEVKPGEDPSWPFLRALLRSVGVVGTIFMWSPYENSVLNTLLVRLREDNRNECAPNDFEILEEFILSITKPRIDDKSRKAGKRAMVDLARLAELYFFHPYTQGRSSIKVLLPAVLRDSTWLKQRYSHPVYGATNGIKSLNFQNMQWWVSDHNTGLPVDPYKLLPSLFEDYPQDVIDALEGEGDGDIKEGGAAATAYGRLQFTNMEKVRREALVKALLRYCELDTLAMVMVVEAWREWCKTLKTFC